MKEYQLTKFDQIFLGIIYGFIFPILFFLIFWWVSIPLVPEKQIFIFAFSGLGLGIIIDLVFLKFLIKNSYRIKGIYLILVYIFYSIGYFGFFMGVPIFNLFLGIPAGIFIARKSVILNLSTKESNQEIERISKITSGIMLVICLISATIALNDIYTVSGLKGMLGLMFPISQELLVGLIIVGGIVLIIGQYFVTKYSYLLVRKIF